jgi:hypothetical protein
MAEFQVLKPTEPVTESDRLEPALNLFEAADDLLTAWEKWNDHRDLPRVRKELEKVQQALDACKSLTLN